jgi:hypothetical protein
MLEKWEERASTWMMIQSFQ